MEHSMDGVILKFSMLLAGALALLVLGGWGVRIAERLCLDALRSLRPESGWLRAASLVLRAMLWSALLISILGLFGIQTAGFVVLLATLGLAIGLAWSGVLANLAAGSCLMVLRPFGVGDNVTIAGITGEVMEVGLFGTRVNRSDNVCVLISNQRVLADAVVNYSINPYRRVEVEVRLPHVRGASQLMEALCECARGIANVVRTPAPRVVMLELGASKMLIAVRAFCHHRDHDQVHSDLHAAIQVLMLNTINAAPASTLSFIATHRCAPPPRRETAAADIHIDRSG